MGIYDRDWWKDRPQQQNAPQQPSTAPRRKPSAWLQLAASFVFWSAVSYSLIQLIKRLTQ
ncbi:hypothetical protein LMG23994_00704 [Cupriavidus pinatubonensis]|uniref:Transmembrane protein n=1 Tax=Cupriavidus pinatubonensis TaxID=248026 RepID=A0ABN7XZI9_9BURK|nr:hypothetical protein LMG23994_00704 [Cupriavidus pinatubonensis]